MTAGLLPIASPAAAVTPPPANYFVVTDQQGANDVPAQSDLTQMGRDDTDSALYKLFWSWDSTDQWAGAGQTGDACALFDFNGNGNVDAVVCGQIHNPNGSTATVEQTVHPYVFRCDDSKNDRCGQPSAPQSYTFGTDVTSGTLFGLAASPPADLITDTDPFNASAPNGPGDNYPNDSSLAVTIAKAYLGTLAQDLGAKYPAIPGATPTLVNVCSYPSAGNGGNNNPFDCIVNPGGGFLVVTKNASPVDGTFSFSTPAGTKSLTTVSGTKSTDPMPLAIADAASSNYSVTETVPGGWDLKDLSCAVEGSATKVGTVSSPTISKIPIVSGKATTCTFTNVKQNPALSLTKTPSPTTYSNVGDVISYTLVAKNTGNVTLTNVSISDPKLGTLTCTQPVTLAPNATLTCTGSYTITQADLNAGEFNNTATVNGTFNGQNVSATASAKVTAVQTPAISLTKTPTPTTYSKVGDVISYTLVAKNTGNVTLTNVSISDPKLGTLTCTQPVTLAPNATLTCTGSYTITQADLDAGKVDNTATVTGKYNNNTVTATASATVNAARAPSMSLTKTASPTTYSGSGQTITYTYVVKNTGNVTLTAPINVTDDHIGNPVNTPILCSNNNLAPGQSVTCGATYVTTQSDVNAGKVTNTAIASSKDGTTSQPAKATVTFVPPPTPGLGLAKSATPTTYKTVGETITYSYVVTNTGNVTLSGPFTIADNKTTATSCPTTASLAPGATITCTGTYQITQADLDAGSVTNVATASGGGITSAPATATVTAVADPRFSLQKSANPPSGSVVQPGQRIDYSVTYTNTGNVTLADVVINDHVPDGTTYVDGSAKPAGATYDAAANTVSWHTGSVAPGSAVTVTFAVTVNADLAAGSEVVNSATVGTQASNETRHPVASGDLSVTKTVDKATAEFGDTLTYTVTVATTGTLDQTGVVATDVIPDGTTYVPGSATCASPCTASYDASTRTVTWNVGDVAAGKSVTGLVFQVVIDQVTPNPDGSIPSRIITNVAEVMSDQVTTVPSPPVTTVVTAVLGEQQQRPPVTPLPFTGAPIQQLVSLALLLLVVGVALATRRRRSS